MSTDKLAGRIAVVTGASRGIGRAIAGLFAQEGAVVAGCSRHIEDGGFLQDLAPTERTRHLLLTCDVRLAGQIHSFRDQVLAKLGAPQILVNNAGTVARMPTDSLPEAVWDDILAANLKGTFLMVQAFLPALRRHEQARIINMSSIAGRQGTPLLSAYCASKHGVVGLTRSLAEELRPEGIAVNAICPGSVDTEMLAIGRPGAKPDMTPADVARTALFLAADAPAVMTGRCIDVFG
jgi:NAD(P)-dependent dehydrogenase (short-subunit alcohol dehydrogenase family)